MTVDRSELKENLLRIREDIQTASKNSSKPVRLIAVSKTKPAEFILEAYQLGQIIFGENKVQEAQKKSQELPDSIDWHLIGPLQKNKAKYCPGLFSTIHSVDNYALAAELNRRCEQKQTPVQILLQANLSRETTKSGVLSYGELLQLINSIHENCAYLQPIGLMTIPSPDFSETETGNCYARLRNYLEKIGKELKIEDSFCELSMGMSNDYLLAIREGATFVRVGSSIFGAREYK